MLRDFANFSCFLFYLIQFVRQLINMDVKLIGRRSNDYEKGDLASLLILGMATASMASEKNEIGVSGGVLAGETVAKKFIDCPEIKD